MNKTGIYYKDEDKDNKKLISYEFKSELVMCNSNSLLNNYLLSKNSSISNANSSKNIDDTIESILNECINKYEKLFYNTILNEYIEDGYISDSQRLFKIISEEYGNNISGIFLNRIYTKYVFEGKVVKSLLYIMSRLNPDHLNGVQEGIIAFALNHKDYEIRDLALQCFEQWDDIKYLDLLRSLDMDVDFLQEYLDCIIECLEMKSDQYNVH